MTAQRYDDEVVEPHLLLCLKSLPNSHSHMATTSLNNFEASQADLLSWFSDLSSIQFVWNIMSRTLKHLSNSLQASEALQRQLHGTSRRHESPHGDHAQTP